MKVLELSGGNEETRATLGSALLQHLKVRGRKVSVIVNSTEQMIRHDSSPVCHRFLGTGVQEIVEVTQSAVIWQGQDLPEWTELSSILQKMAVCDVVIIDGFNAPDVPSLCIVHDDNRMHSLMPSNVIAVVGRPSHPTSLPTFDVASVPAIGAFIEAFLDKGKEERFYSGVD